MCTSDAPKPKQGFLVYVLVAHISTEADIRFGSCWSKKLGARYRDPQALVGFMSQPRLVFGVGHCDTPMEFFPPANIVEDFSSSRGWARDCELREVTAERAATLPAWGTSPEWEEWERNRSQADEGTGEDIPDDEADRVVITDTNGEQHRVNLRAVANFRWSECTTYCILPINSLGGKITVAIAKDQIGREGVSIIVFDILRMYGYNPDSVSFVSCFRHELEELIMQLQDHFKHNDDNPDEPPQEIE